MTIRPERATQAAHASATMHGRLENGMTTLRGVGLATKLTSLCQGVDDLFRGAPSVLRGGARLKEPGGVQMRLQLQKQLPHV